MRTALLVCLVCLVCGAPPAPAALPEGNGQVQLTAGGETFDVWTYKPVGYRGGPLLMTFHGLGRNAEAYRDAARPLADRFGLLVVAPQFDAKRFPGWRYHSAGLVRERFVAGVEELSLEPEEQWTSRHVLGLVDAARQAEGRPGLGYLLLGHSAGGQMLSRIVAFTPTSARGILIANPSSFVWPSRDRRFPYGFGGLPERLADDAALRRYLNQPLTVLTGTADTGAKDLDTRPGAVAQGANRHERAVAFYREAERLARARGWAFAWQLYTVPGVGHSARDLYAAAPTTAAIAERLRPR
ncbi:MAG: alpha/beta hydrolase [Burkholderiales bacterium]